jgi:Putative DNA-binding domain
MTKAYAPSDSVAEEFFNELVAQKDAAFATLQSLAQKGIEENEWRDFKETAWYDVPIKSGEKPADSQRKRDDKLKEIWSESIGAFANSGGGVLIWGIKAPTRKSIGLSLARNASAMADRLQQLANDATDPPVLGIEIQSVTENGGSGFVICHIPQSRFAPHASRWAKHDFYIRSQDGNVRCPTAVLRRLFYPLTSALVVPTIHAAMDQTQMSHFVTQFRAHLTNRGTGSARDVFVQVSINLTLGHYWPDSRFWATVSMPGSTHGFSALQTIHPDQSVPLLNNIVCDFGEKIPEDDLILDFSIFAADCSPVHSTARFSHDELARISQGGSIDRDATIKSVPW